MNGDNDARLAGVVPRRKGENRDDYEARQNPCICGDRPRGGYCACIVAKQAADYYNREPAVVMLGWVMVVALSSALAFLAGALIY